MSKGTFIELGGNKYITLCGYDTEKDLIRAKCDIQRALAQIIERKSMCEIVEMIKEHREAEVDSEKGRAADDGFAR